MPIEANAEGSRFTVEGGVSLQGSAHSMLMVVRESIWEGPLVQDDGANDKANPDPSTCVHPANYFSQWNTYHASIGSSNLRLDLGELDMEAIARSTTTKRHQVLQNLGRYVTLLSCLHVYLSSKLRVLDDIDQGRTSISGSSLPGVVGLTASNDTHRDATRYQIYNRKINSSSTYRLARDMV
ncbi:hypothetical protein BKA70DRAFT_1403730 [Coprinopsis sp. MPI-PUGE-AT-0042]|nr:hypothetical protein BKA70DRAFT_1403730 [Coprinopsis sp. MPI-PUGE-AT-0042]